MQPGLTARYRITVRRIVRMPSVVGLLAVAIGVLPIRSTDAEPARPIALHPDNPHYFLWRDKPTVLITSGEHYGALLNLDFDFVRYFNELQATISTEWASAFGKKFARLSIRTCCGRKPIW